MERLIVFALLFLLPTQLAYHFWLPSSYILGLRVDYLSPAIFLKDILIVFLIPYLIKRIKLRRIKLNKKAFILIISVTLLAILNIVFAESWVTAFLKWIVVLKFAVLGFYFYFCDLTKLRKTIIISLSLSLILFSLIGLIQFILQRTIGGPFYYLGERSFTSQTPGIALVTLFGYSLMRAYSTFSHPNSFAGFVVPSFLILLSFSPRLKSLSKGFLVVFAAVIISLLLTLSLNAIIGVCLVVVFYFALNKFPKTIKRVKVFLPTVLILLSLLFGVFSASLPRSISLKETYKERITQAGFALQAFSERPLLGVGLNNFFTATKSVQPPHNIYLIALSETGILGTLFVFILLTKILNRKLNKYLFLALVFVLFTGLIDHYWLTLQQNELLLSLLVGLAVRRDFFVKNI